MKNKKKLKQDKKRLTRMAENSISVQAFLSRILGVRDNSSLSGVITHDDIKELLPKLVRPSFDYILDNPDTVFNGEVFLVEDSLGRVVPYFNPSFIYEEIDYIGEYQEESTTRETMPDVNNLDLGNLNNYELQNLLRLYGSQGLRGAYRLVHEELVHRKNSHHASNESKARTLRKERKNEKFEY